MEEKFLRQLRDIQVQAQRLTSERSLEQDFEQFDRYNEEFKDYILLNSNSDQIKKLINEIPRVINPSDEKNSTSTIILVVLGLLTFGFFAVYVYYANRMRRQRIIRNNIQTARGKYASIEFLLKAEA